MPLPNKNDFFVSFNSFREFLEDIESGETNNLISESSCESQSIKRLEWFGSNTFDEALETARGIWKEGFALMEKRLPEYHEYWDRKFPLQTTGLELQHNVTGDFLDIDAYIKREGPEVFGLFIKNDERLVGTSHQTFLINSLYHCGISAETVIERGCFIGALINLLELRGTRTSLYAYFKVRTYCAGEYLLGIKLKSFSEYLDINMMNFVFGHPSMLRRLIFRNMECCNLAPYLVNNGYGQCQELNEKDIEKLFLEGENIENSLNIQACYSNNIEDIRGKILDDLNKILRKDTDKLEEINNERKGDI